MSKNEIKIADPTHGGTISLELAQIRILKWLKIIAAIPGFKEKNGPIPRALFIPFEDIKLLEAAHSKDGLIGIRVYFGIAGENHPVSPTDTDLRGIIVPVLKPDIAGNYNDLINIDPLNQDHTSIYDFTTPCPAYCDLNSKLYVPLP